MMKGLKPLTAVDLFCGCGGVTEGLKAGGFQVVAAVDNDPIACKTYKMNHPSVHLYEQDIHDVDPKDILANLKGEKLDLLVVCAPCQPFSSQNRKKGRDSRSNLIMQSVRFAEILNPTIIFFENVPGLATKRFRGILEELKDGLNRLGYNLGEPVQINAADYGVPQRRIRCVLIASKSKIPTIPEPVTPAGKWKTVRDAIAHLPPLQAGQKDPTDPLHFARSHSPIAIKRLQHIPKDGGSRFSLPPELELKCHKNKKGYPDVYGRMKWDDVAPTLTTGCTDITRGRFAHPRDDRAITLREAALLQTFPVNYKFAGNSSQIAAQIGNAVPVKMVEAIAINLHKFIEGAG